MIEDYRALAGRIRQDLNDLDAVCSRVDAIWRRYQDSGDEYYIDAAALNVHDFYAGLERIFEAIARRIDQSMPEGPHWHEDLLDHRERVGQHLPTGPGRGARLRQPGVRAALWEGTRASPQRRARPVRVAL